MPFSRIFTFPAFFSLLLISCIAGAQPSAAPVVLELEKAIDLALEHNRTVRSAVLETEKSTERLAAAQTKFFPVFDFSVLASRLLTPLDFTFEQGVFGTYPGIGPIPGEETSITTPRQITAYIVASVQQPLSQLYRIRLNQKLLESSRDESGEKEREQMQTIINEVKKSYYGILQSESALRYAEEQIRLYRELQRVTDDYIVRQVALKSDGLEVKSRLAKAEYDALSFGNQVDTQKEQLNLLLGRDIRTDFSVSPVPEETLIEQDIATAQDLALQRRPELQQARFQLKQAEYDRRIKKAEYIPDVSLSFNYISPQNIEFIPQNIVSAGVYVSWEIFDWGRKGHELAEKERIVQQARLTVTETENKILVDVNSQYRKLQESRKLVSVTRLAQEAAQEKVRVAANKYKEQAALLKDVLQAQTSLEETKDQYQNSLLSFWTAKADFEKSLGEDQ